ncbi:MAG: DUF2079 domain-containing protein [Thermoplasmata archaeon]|nr:DUF2079 domain-containing protein [Thermoplasmata archaeon]
MSGQPSTTPRQPQPVPRLVDGLARWIGAGSRRWRGLEWEARLLVLIVAVVVGVMTAFSYNRYLTYQTNAWDLGIVMQSIWTTSFQGRLFYYTAELSWNTSGSLLGVHFSPILFTLVPIYHVAPGAFTLLFIQSAVVGASAFPLYLLLRRRTTALASLALCSTYLISAPLLGAVFYDFHMEMFIPFFALSLWYSWETRRPAWTLLFAVGLLSVIEFTPLILGAIALMFLLQGLYLWQSQGRILDQKTLRWSVLLPLVVVPLSVILTFVEFEVPKLISPSTPGFAQTGVLGGSVPTILGNLGHPTILAEALFAHGNLKVIYLFSLLLCGLVLWVLRPIQALPALPWILVVLLTPHTGYEAPAGYQYGFLTIPFFFPGTASGYASVSRYLDRRRARALAPPLVQTPQTWRRRAWRLAPLRAFDRSPVWKVVVVAALAGTFLYTQVEWSPFSPDSNNWEKVYILQNAHTDLLDRVGALVPPTASISTLPDLFPEFADRGDSYPYVHPGVEYLFFDVNDYWYNAQVFPAPSVYAAWNSSISTLTSPYGVVASDDGVYLLKEGYTGPPVIYVPENATLEPSSFSRLSAPLVADPSAPLGAYLEPQPVSNGLLWYGPYVPVAPGNYTVGVWLRAEGVQGGSITLTTTVDAGKKTLAEQGFDETQIGPSWEWEQWKITVPYPSELEIDGSSANTLGWQFGGGELNQTGGAAIVT